MSICRTHVDCLENHPGSATVRPDREVAGGCRQAVGKWLWQGEPPERAGSVSDPTAAGALKRHARCRFRIRCISVTGRWLVSRRNRTNRFGDGIPLESPSIRTLTAGQCDAMAKRTWWHHAKHGTYRRRSHDRAQNTRSGRAAVPDANAQPGAPGQSCGICPPPRPRCRTPGACP